MEVINMSHRASVQSGSSFVKIENNNQKKVIRFVANEQGNVQQEMRLIFFSKGNIFLESDEAKFNLTKSEGLDLDGIECFGQLITTNFDRLVQETSCFNCIGSPVSFRLTFFNELNEQLGTLISESIFKDIGFGIGVGDWMLKEE